jgi:preprotein translocase subunit SecG
MLYSLLIGIYVLVCLLLIVVILLQQGKGGDIASAFGGGGATLLTKMTTGLAAAFIVLSLILAAFGQQGPGSVVGGTEGPAPVETPQPAVPGTLPPPTNGSPQ